METESRADEARATLERVGRDSETLGSSALARVGRRVGAHFGGAASARDGIVDVPDAAEIWGRRVGRALSLGLGAVLLWGLGAQLGWW